MLEVNPGSETKLSGFTAVSGGAEGLKAWFQVSSFKFQRGWEPGFKFQVSCFRYPATLSP